MIYCIFVLIFSILFLQSCTDIKNERGSNSNFSKHESAEQFVPQDSSDRKDFIFVGMIEGKPGLYKYSFYEKTFKPVWANKKEKVVELSYSEESKNAFFITAKNYGKTGAFPYINEIKLYLLNPESGKINLIEEIGDGLQIFTLWVDKNSFKVMLNYIDETVSSHIHQNTKMYNTFGKKISDEIRVFDLAREGYPQPQNNISFETTKYILKKSKKDSTIYLEDKEEEKKIHITKIPQDINRVEWLNQTAVISTRFILPGNKNHMTNFTETSELYIYSISENKIIEKWSGSGFKNFRILNNYLLFDTGFEENSIIILFDIIKNTIIDTIKVEGGSGLKNIPELPAYE